MNIVTVAVIIPYYQKQPGILRRALNSILQQRLSADRRVDIIIVDDGSPLPASSEIEGLDFGPQYNLVLRKQVNSGVAAARNTALLNVSDGTTYVAFLDSDDIWALEHLPTAIATLDLGYDFYFCDSKKLANNSTTFEEKAFGRFLSSDNAVRIGDNIYELERHRFFDNALRGRAFLIPAVVYKRSVAPDLLFNPSLRMAGEDCLFLFSLINKCQRISCSSHLYVTCADGVNMFAGTFSWNDDSHLKRYMGLLLASYAWRKELPLSKANDQFMARRITRLRRLFAFLTMRYVLRFKQLWRHDLVAMTRNDPTFWRWYPVNVLYVGMCFPLRLYNPLNEW